MKVSQVLNCSFAVWYPKFKHVTWKSISIELPQQFIDYLHEDGVVLPEETNAENHVDENNDDDDLTNWDDESEYQSACDASTPSFPVLDAEIKTAISKLGGNVFPKLNWSSPKDASWIALNNSLKCSTPNDVYLLLKSSEFISHDLNQPFKDCEDVAQCNSIPSYALTLRKWIEVNPGMEFRCFVINDELTGVSQRDHTNFYHYLELEKDVITSDIKSMFEEHVKGNFLESSYVMDVYREQNGSVKIVDFNPFGITTDSLLFEWDEFQSDLDGKKLPIFRYVKDEFGIQPSTHRHYSMPIDFVHLGSGEDAYKLIDLLKLQSNGTVESSSDEET